MLSDSHTELDPRVPVLTGVVKAICQRTEATWVQEPLLRALVLAEIAGLPLFAGLHKLAYSKQFSDVEQTLSSSSGVYIVNSL